MELALQTPQSAQYPFWVVDPIGAPNKKADFRLAENYFNYILQQDVVTAADFQNLMYKGTERGEKPLAAVPFVQAHPGFYKPDTDNAGNRIITQRSFKNIYGSEQDDIFHSLSHLIGTAAHSPAGEIRVAVVEATLLSSNMDRMINYDDGDAHTIDRSKFKPASSIREIQESMNFMHDRYLRGFGQVVDMVKYDFKLDHTTDPLGNLDLKRSPEVAKLIAAAAYTNIRFSDMHNSLMIGDFSGAQILKMPIDHFVLSPSEKAEAKLVAGHFTNPNSQITLDSFSHVGRRTLEYMNNLS